MAGRYGSDPLNNALLILGIALIIVARILGWAWMNVFILALLCLCYFRMFSRNIQARYAENEKFMRWWRPVSNRIRGAQGRFADRKTHCYFKCPECGNSDPDHCNVTKRTCGYLGNPVQRPMVHGRHEEIAHRVKHMSGETGHVTLSDGSEREWFEEAK